MPLVQVKIIEGVFSENQKKTMDRETHRRDGLRRGENMRQVTWVTIEEVKSGEWGIGGKRSRPRL